MIIALILNMSISGNVSSVGNTLRIKGTSNGAVFLPINDYMIKDASKFSSSWVSTHFATYHTTHIRANYAATILKIMMVLHV